MMSTAPWLRALLIGMRVLFGFAVVFPMLTAGAVEFEPLAIVTMVVAASTIIVCWRPIRQPQTSRIATLALVCLIVLMSVEYAQSIRFPDNPWQHASWAYVRTLVGPVDGAVSVVPEQTRADIVAWVPLLAFVAALHLFNRRSEALLLIRSLSFLAVAVALISLGQFFLAPTMVGLEAKTAYANSLTGLYVNRNSAGTFFGLGIIVSAGLVIFQLGNDRPAGLVGKIIAWQRLTKSERMVVYLSAGMLVEVLALAATQSRGAAAATFIALLTLAWIFRGGRHMGRQRRMRWMRFAFVAALVSIVAVLVGQEVIYRMNAQAVDEARLCTYASTWQAIRDNWPWGAGFGSFPDVFPAYRAAQCSGIDGVWDAAHNSYLEGALGLGLPFVITVTLALASLVQAFATGLRHRHVYRFAPAIGFAGLLLIALHSLIDFSLQIPGNALFLAALLAACVTLSLDGKTPHRISVAAGSRRHRDADALQT